MPGVGPKTNRLQQRLWRNFVIGPFLVFATLLTIAILHSLLGRSPLLSHQIYFNGDVITMDENQPFADAVVVKNGRIDFVGNNDDALAERVWYSSVIDLNQQTLLPGFIDAHSHFLSTGLTARTLNLNPPPAGSTDSLKLLYQAVQSAVTEKPEGHWILGFNYDNTLFSDGKHPDRIKLDEISTEHPIYLRHHSGHMGVGNSAALTLLEQKADFNYRLDSANLNDPHIGRYPDTSEPNGLLLEHAAPSMQLFLDDMSIIDYVSIYRQAVRQYTSNGFTTVQEGNASTAQVRLLRWLSRLAILPFRMVIWLSGKNYRTPLLEGSMPPAREVNEWYRADTIKLISDGSPQGYTAYLTRPYHKKRGWPVDHRGSLLMNRLMLEKIMKEALKLRFRLAIHANGDAAIDEVLNTLRTQNVLAGDTCLQASAPCISLVHAQTVRMDQLDAIAELGLALNYFPGHTYYWGDWHRQQALGPQRAASISPLKSTTDRHIPFTIHSDAPVSPPDAMHMLWSATTRQTRDGEILGQHELIDRSSALHALTIFAARLSGLNDRGAIKEGLLADITILSGNPLNAADPRQLSVVETIVGGKVIYSAPR